jgi:hypothetical protein
LVKYAPEISYFIPPYLGPLPGKSTAGISMGKLEEPPRLSFYIPLI